MFLADVSLPKVSNLCFEEIEGLQRELLWDGRPRIALNKLILSWYDGGIGLPHIRKYY